jgi:RNA polymerase sigma factor (sigma-70 family)
MPGKTLTDVVRDIGRLANLRAELALPDGQLLERYVRQRDEAAFEALLHRHGPLVFGVCRRLLYDAHDAEDAFQATFLILARKADSIVPRSLVGNWLYGVAYRVAARARKAACRRTRGQLGTDLTAVPARETPGEPDLAPLLHAEVERLPDKYRIPVVLCYLEGKTNEEAARQLQWPVGTVKIRLSRARELLRSRLSRRGVALTAGLLAANMLPTKASAALVQGTFQAALAFAASGAAAGSTASAQAFALTKGALKTMFLSKLKFVAAAVLSVAVVAGAGGLAYHGLAIDPPAKDDKKTDKSKDAVSDPGVPAKGDDNDANAVLDKAIKAIGGEARLLKAKAIAWKARGKSVNNGNEYPFTNETTVQGLDQIRMEYEDEIDGNRVRGATVLNGDKGWRKNGDNITQLDGDRLANQKRNLYLLVVPITLVPLKGKTFQIEPAGEQKVGDKPAIGLKVTGPDGKDFNLFFDKTSGLPVKLEVRMGSQGKEFTQETTFGDYKDFDGIKKATKIERRRDGQKILEQEITEFKVLDKVAPETFAEPK